MRWDVEYKLRKKITIRTASLNLEIEGMYECMTVKKTTSEHLRRKMYN